MESKYRLGTLVGGRPAAPIEVLHAAPRCHAHSKRTKKPCGQPAMRGKRVCRFHGGKSTGPRTKEGKARVAKAAYRHGRYTKESVAARQAEAQWWRENMGRNPPSIRYGNPNASRDPVTGRFNRG